MSFLTACSVPFTAAVATEVPVIPTETFTPVPTQTLIPKPNPTLIPIERATPTKIATPEPTKIVYPQYDRWVSGRESVFVGSFAITIDDCNDEVILKSMLDMLEARGIRATFFPNTNYITGHSSDLWARIIKNHQIADHTTGHRDLRKFPMTVEQLENDWVTFQNAIRQKTGNSGYVITAVRAPYYAWSPELVQMAKNHNAYLIQSTVSPVDIDINTFDNIIKANGNGGILIFHTDPKSLLWFTSYLNRLQGKFVRIDDVFR